MKKTTTSTTTNKTTVKLINAALQQLSGKEDLPIGSDKVQEHVEAFALYCSTLPNYECMLLECGDIRNQHTWAAIFMAIQVPQQIMNICEEVSDDHAYMAALECRYVDNSFKLWPTQKLIICNSANSKELWQTLYEQKILKTLKLRDLCIDGNYHLFECAMKDKQFTIEEQIKICNGKDVSFWQLCLTDDISRKDLLSILLAAQNITLLNSARSKYAITEEELKYIETETSAGLIKWHLKFRFAWLSQKDSMKIFWRNTCSRARKYKVSLMK